MDIVALNRQAVRRSVEIVSAVRDDQWHGGTPCAGWSLRDLLAHMIAEHRGFAAAAAGDGSRESAWRTRQPGPDPAAEYRDAVDEVIAAFSAADVLEREFQLPKISARRGFPARQAIGFHLVDYVVHGWDVAAAAGLDAGYGAEVTTAALEIAHREVPVGPSRERPGASFGPALPVPGGAADWDRLLLLLGRDPRWRPT